MDNFEIFGVIDKLSRANLLYLVVQRFAEIDMSDANIVYEMGRFVQRIRNNILSICCKIQSINGGHTNRNSQHSGVEQHRNIDS